MTAALTPGTRECALSVCEPSVGPSRQDTEAEPVLSVITTDLGSTNASGSDGVKSIVSPTIGRPSASAIRTTIWFGSRYPGTPVWPSPVTCHADGVAGAIGTS